MVLRKKVVDAFFWTIISFVSNKLIRLASNLLLARLLFPDLFGLISIIYVVISVVAMLTDLGVGPYLIQNKEKNTLKVLNTAWTFQIIRGVAVWLVLCFLSLILYFVQTLGLLTSGNVYSEEELPFLIVAASLSMVISGFNSISIHTLSRELNLKKIFTITAVSRLSSAIATIVFAVYNPTIWALISGALIYSFLFMMASHSFISEQHVHKLLLDRDVAKKIIGFGKWILVSTMMTLAVMHGDKLILGGFVNAKTLGLYAIAFLFIEAIKGLFSTINSRIWFPLLSEVKRQGVDQITDVYYKIRLYQDMLGYLVAGVLFVIAPQVIDVLYDERYKGAGYIFSILSLSITSIGLETIGQVFIAMGLSKYTSFINISRAVVLWFGLYFILTQYSFSVALWFIALGHFVSIPLAWFFLRKAKMFIWYKELRTMPFIVIGYFLGEFISWQYVLISME